MRSLNPNLKILAVPLVGIPLVLILFVVGISRGYPSITKQLEDIKLIQEEKITLEKKLSSLKNIQGSILEQTNISVVALPQKNPSTQAVSLLKKYTQDSVEIGKINVDLGSNEDMKSSSIETNLSFAEGLSSALDYLNNLKNSLPLMAFNKMSAKNKDGEVSVNLENSAYWAEFPEKLPPLERPVTQLTSDESQLLENLSNMEKPEFTTLDPSEPQDERINPFL